MDWDYPSLCLVCMRHTWGSGRAIGVRGSTWCLGGALNRRALAGAQRRFALPHRPAQSPPFQGVGVRGSGEGVIFSAASVIAQTSRIGAKPLIVWRAKTIYAPQKTWARDGVMWQSEAPLNPSPRPSLLLQHPGKQKTRPKSRFLSQTEIQITESWLCCADLLGNC